MKCPGLLPSPRTRCRFFAGQRGRRVHRLIREGVGVAVGAIVVSGLVPGFRRAGVLWWWWVAFFKL